MEGEGVNMFQVETEPAPDVALGKVTRAKQMNLPKPKVSHASAGIISNFMTQMVLLDQMDPRRLKSKTENRADFFIHSCKHYSTLLKIPWKVNSSVKKENKS